MKLSDTVRIELFEAKDVHLLLCEYSEEIMGADGEPDENCFDLAKVTNLVNAIGQLYLRARERITLENRS